MTEYHEITVNFSPSQVQNIKSGIKNKTSVRVQLSRESLNNGNVLFPLTKTQVDKLSKLDSGKSARITLSNAQLSKFNVGKSDAGSETIPFNLTVKNNAELKKLMLLSEAGSNLEKLFEGKGLGSIFKVALPFIKKVLPKVLGTLGLAGASGAISGIAHRKVSGGTIDLTKSEVENAMEFGNCLC